MPKSVPTSLSEIDIKQLDDLLLESPWVSLYEALIQIKDASAQEKQKRNQFEAKAKENMHFAFLLFYRSELWSYIPHPKTQQEEHLKFRRKTMTQYAEIALYVLKDANLCQELFEIRFGLAATADYGKFLRQVIATESIAHWFLDNTKFIPYIKDHARNNLPSEENEAMVKVICSTMATNQAVANRVVLDENLWSLLIESQTAPYVKNRLTNEIIRRCGKETVETFLSAERYKKFLMELDTKDWAQNIQLGKNRYANNPQVFQLFEQLERENIEREDNTTSRRLGF